LLDGRKEHTPPTEEEKEEINQKKAH
jgi:hypothetical protein